MKKFIRFTIGFTYFFLGLMVGMAIITHLMIYYARLPFPSNFLDSEFILFVMFVLFYAVDTLIIEPTL